MFFHFKSFYCFLSKLEEILCFLLNSPIKRHKWFQPLFQMTKKCFVKNDFHCYLELIFSKSEIVCFLPVCRNLCDKWSLRLILYHFDHNRRKQNNLYTVCIKGNLYTLCIKDLTWLDSMELWNGLERFFQSLIFLLNLTFYFQTHKN